MMSLELEIKNLNDTILKLIATMEKQPVQLELPFETKVESKTETKTEKVAEKETTEAKDKTITAEELQSQCMTLVRKDKANKVKIKELLKEFEVELLAELDKEALPNFARRLGEL